MKLKDLIAGCPPQADLQKYVEAHIRGLYSGHLENLRLAQDKEHPFQADGIQWLEEAKELARDIIDENLTLNPVMDNQVVILARLNVPRETTILRDQDRLLAKARKTDNRDTVWRTIK